MWSSIALVPSWLFANLRNKIDKILKLFDKLEDIRKQGVIC